MAAVSRWGQPRRANDEAGSVVSPGLITGLSTPLRWPRRSPLWLAATSERSRPSISECGSVSVRFEFVVRWACLVVHSPLEFRRLRRQRASTLALRLRPTVWPSQPVPPPPVLRLNQAPPDGAWLLFDSSTRDYAEVPPEVHLREFNDTHPGDVEALVRLCSLGMIRPVRLGEPAGDLDIPEGAWQYAMERISAAIGLPSCADIEAERRARHQQDSAHRFPVHVAEVAYRVSRVQQCTEHVRAYLAGEPLSNVWDDCDDDRDAWFRFDSVTTPALRDFHVRVRVQVGDEPSEPFEIGGVRASLYSVAMLQLVNDLAEDVSYSRCANETCGRLFARQRGRTQYGGHRMQGVRYCSSTCARAQYQREKRRRDRTALNGAEHG